jgi:hypothetical protein
LKTANARGKGDSRASAGDRGIANPKRRRRCDAVFAWGDGREPYLANASADERCSVEQEARELLREEMLFESKQVKI